MTVARAQYEPDAVATQDPMETHGRCHRATRLVAAAFALSVIAPTAAASAHGLDPDRVEVVLHGDTVEAVATPPVDFVRFADVNNDGLLSLDEVNPRREEIRRALVEALSITDEEGRAGALDRSDVSLPHGHDGEPSNGRAWLRVTVKLRWPAAPRAIRVRCAFARVRPVTVYATRAEADTPGVLTLAGVPELGLLERATSSATLLRMTNTPAPSADHRAPNPLRSVPRRADETHRVGWLGALALCGLALAASRLRSLRLEPPPPPQGETR